MTQGDLKANAFFNAYDDVAWSRRLRREIADLARSGIGKDIRELPIQSLKKSDTLFILGSGASIEDLDDAAFEQIGEHDSLGLNFWMIHPFVPTYHFLEFSPHRERNEVMSQLLELRASDYADVPLIVEYKDCSRCGESLSRIPDTLRDHLFLQAPWCLGTPWPGQVRWGLRLWSVLDRLGLIGLERMIHHRTSLTLAVMFGVVCGYKKLVLLGVDLNNTDYFWETTPEKYERFPKPPRVETGTIHSTSNPELNPLRGTLSVPEYFTIFRRVVLDPRGIRYYVGSKKSALYRQGFELYSDLARNRQ